MLDELDPVQGDEFVFRRILKRLVHVELDQHMPVSRLAFRPNSDDTDGISMFRKFFTDAAAVAAVGSNSLGYFVAEISARHVQDNGLSLRPDPRADWPRGHCLVPEIRLDTQNITKGEQLALARLASANLVHKPPG